MTQRYAHLSPAYKRAMVERMEQIWAKPASRPAEMLATKNLERSCSGTATPQREPSLL